MSDLRHIRHHQERIPYTDRDGNRVTTTPLDVWTVYAGDLIIGQCLDPLEAVNLKNAPPPPDRRGQGRQAPGGEPPAPPASDGQAPPEIYDTPMAGILIGLAWCGAAWIAAWALWAWLG